MLFHFLYKKLTHFLVVKWDVAKIIRFKTLRALIINWIIKINVSLSKSLICWLQKRDCPCNKISDLTIAQPTVPKLFWFALLETTIYQGKLMVVKILKLCLDPISLTHKIHVVELKTFYSLLYCCTTHTLCTTPASLLFWWWRYSL